VENIDSDIDEQYYQVISAEDNLINIQPNNEKVLTIKI
jgi:hypothetical protein